jgi:hypothetical protein
LPQSDKKFIPSLALDF